VAKSGQIKGLIYYHDAVKEITMTVVKVDTENDLALLKFEPPFDGKPIKLAERVAWGEPVIFGGYNSLKTPRLRFGFVTYNNKGIMAHPVFYGDSGAPMFNTDNELVGIIYRMDIAIVRTHVVPARVFTLVGYAVPIDKIREFLNE